MPASLVYNFDVHVMKSMSITSYKTGVYLRNHVRYFIEIVSKFQNTTIQRWLFVVYCGIKKIISLPLYLQA